jgi:hypothetical protein
VRAGGAVEPGPAVAVGLAVAYIDYMELRWQQDWAR